MKRFTIIYLFLAFVFLFSGCEKEEKSPKGITLEEAKFITHKTYGIIPPAGQIIVRFGEPMIPENQVNVPFKKKVFSFSPGIDGETSWKDRYTIVFKPNRALEMRKKFTGELDIEKLFPEKKDITIKGISIEFEVCGREIRKADWNFELVDEDDPIKLRFVAQVGFTVDTDIESVKKSVKFMKKDKELKLDIKYDEETDYYVIKSKVLIRTDKYQSFHFFMFKDKLELSRDYSQIVNLPALKNFTVEEVKKEISDLDLSVTIKFSDELKPDRNYDGFVQIEPPLDIALRISGNKLIVRGDFSYGETYTVKVNSGMKSKWGTTLEKIYETDIEFPDLEPQVAFTHTGVYLPSSNQQKITFKTANVRKVDVTVKQVFCNNLVFFLQENNLEGSKTRSYSGYELQRVGLTVAEDSVIIGDTRNRWLQSELDLSKIFEPEDKGLYVLELDIDKDDVLYDFPEDWDRWDINYYFYDHGHVVKPIILTDIGLTAKKAGNEYVIFASNIISTKPIVGAQIELKSYQNQTLAKGTTNSDGQCILESEDVFLVEAEHDGERSVLKINESGLNTSLFDVGGSTIKQSGLRAFIYTERGVYRPGDTTNLSIILRNQENTFPDNHPVSIKLYNPQNRLVLEKTNRVAKKGFYAFSFATNENDLTGSWKVKVLVGETGFSHTIRVETIVPYRLKVELESDRARIGTEDKEINVTIESKYLFGSPAASHDCDITFKIQPYNISFKKFENFIFAHAGINMRSIESPLVDGRLDEAGKAEFSWDLPEIKEAPSGLKVVADATVFEKGGRQVPNRLAIPFDIYDAYVGISKPDAYWIRSDAPTQFHVILVSSDGKPIAGRTLNYRIYQNSRHWWYDYDDRQNFRKHFKTNTYTDLVETGSVVTQGEPVPIEYTPTSYGRIMVEVQDGETGHVAGYFMYVRSWGMAGNIKNADILTVKADREKYNPGDTAIVIVQTPPEGKALLSIEKGYKVLSTNWYELEEEETVFKIPITEEMLPTAYAFVSVVQPHAQTSNDRPIRMFGVVPLNVEEEKTHLEFIIDAPEEINPGKEFEIKVQTTDFETAQFTIAVVDEGLLDITRFKTPDPWAFFFAKQALMVKTFDMFSKVIGANWGNIFKSFSIGGGMEELYESEHETGKKAKRFKPVAMFKGPLMTDQEGFAKIRFKMPEYIGSVRIMVVGTRGDSYGNSEETVPVRAPLMLMPTLPRVLGPEDRIIVPVTVFAMKDNIGDVEISIKTEGVVKTVGTARKTLTFDKKGEEDIIFGIKANAEIGTAKIIISAKSSKHSAVQETDITVRASNPHIYTAEEKIIEKGQRVAFTVPADGIPGTNTAKITVSQFEKLKLNHRLRWLIRYPYGCIEQTVSAAFPQLYLKEIMDLDEETLKEIDKNINATINRLRKFQIVSGGFSYWPNGSGVSDWGSNYAGHFMLEARNRGYHVPEIMFKNWIKYEKSAIRATAGKLLTRAYRLYLLALAGEPQLGPMNLMKENSMEFMNNTAKWYLAAAYKLAGADKVSLEIIKKTGTDVEEYREFGGTYGSTLRDKAIILEMLILFEEYERAIPVYRDIQHKMATRNWYSTQTTGYSLIAMGKYLQKMQREKGLSGVITLTNGEKVKFKTDKVSFSVPITEGFGKEVSVKLDTDRTAFAILEWEGIPLRDGVVTESKNLNVEIEWLDEDGSIINPQNIMQGTTFWGHFKVKNTSRDKVEEAALVQLLPAGWEIENIRLSGEKLPSWMNKYRINYREYIDIRDDRIMWFFDISSYSKSYDFVVKLNAVTAGNFYLPPTLLEAMYDNNYRATVAGKNVSVKQR